jgi:ATP-binding cassette subfamily C protein LapB
MDELEQELKRPEPRLDRGPFGSMAFPQGPPVGRGVFLGSLTLNLLSLGLPVVILQVYDRILPHQAVETFAFLILALCGVLVLDAFIRIARAHVTGWEAAKYEHRANCGAVERLLATSIESFERDAPGVHLDRLNAIGTLRDFHAGQAKLLMVDLPFIVVFLTLIWLIAGALVLVLITLLALLALCAFLVGRVLQRALQERVSLDKRRYNFIIEVLEGIMTAKGLAMESLLLRRYERLQQSGAANTYQVTFFSNFSQSLGALFSNLTMIAVASAGAIDIIAGQLTVGGLAACTLLSGRTVQPLLRALGLWAQFQGIRLAEERMRGVFGFQAEPGLDKPSLGALEGRIELRGLAFSYDADAPPLLEDVNLSVEPGEVIGISGGTGSGKSTLLLLMTGALRATSGVVLYDGNDIAEFEPRSLRRQVAFMGQSTTLFQGTILDNLALFGDRDREEAALEAARLLGLDRQIHRLPLGYGTKVGDGAQNDLPSGLACSVAMARGLAEKPKVLLFDEANSTLDAKSDAALKEALKSIKGSMTMILISQRPSFLALADRVFDLVGGRLVERAGESPRRDRPEADEGKPTAWTPGAGQGGELGQLSLS